MHLISQETVSEHSGFIFATTKYECFLFAFTDRNLILTLSAPIETKVDQSKNPSCPSILSQEGNLQHRKYESHLVI